jgi:hypothetical protein
VKFISFFVRPLPKNRKRNFSSIEENKAFPDECYHVRESERKIHDSYYETLAALQGAGLSLPKAMEAFVLVANLFFKRDFKLPDGEDHYDIDTLPAPKNCRLFKYKGISLTDFLLL